MHQSKYLTLLCFSPVDHTRVKLALKTTNQDTDYVNANFVKVKSSWNSPALFTDILWFDYIYFAKWPSYNIFMYFQHLSNLES